MENSNPTETTPDLLATLAEHRGCRKLIGEVEDCLNVDPADPEQWVSTLHDAVRNLARGLQEHFQSEENGPLFSALPASHPHLATALGELKEEHSEILDDVASALARANALHGPERFQLRELTARVQILVARICRHEAQENELVIRAHWEGSIMGD
jgi:hypothetical protein